MYDPQDDIGRGDNNEMNLEGNLVNEEKKINEEELGQFPNEDKIATKESPIQPIDDNSFHVSEFIDKKIQDPNFIEKEREICQKLDAILKKRGKSISLFTDYFFLANKILMLTTFSEYFFQRFDIITLFLCFVIILIEIGIFTHKHLYKWLLVLIGSLLLDALVLIDISPVSKILINIFEYF